MKSNVRRLSRLLLSGNLKNIISPDSIEGKNTFQKILKFNNHKIKTVLKQTMNSTFNELATAAKESPKAFLKNLICFAPNIFRLLRSQEAPENRRRSKQYIGNVLKTTGEVSLLVNPNCVREGGIPATKNFKILIFY
jgi:hypothetical protein